MTKIFSISVVLASLLFVPVMAKDKVSIHQIDFKKGTTSATVKGHIKGYDTVNYTLTAKKGQEMHISLKSSKAYFNMYEAEKDVGNEAMFIGSIKGSNFTGKLAKSGIYTIQVYLMRNEARRGTFAPYTLSVEVER